MSRSLRRGALAASAIASRRPLAVRLRAPGSNAQTLEVKPDNAATTVGTSRSRTRRSSPRPGRGEGPAVVTARIFNNGRGAETLDVDQPVRHQREA